MFARSDVPNLSSLKVRGNDKYVPRDRAGGRNFVSWVVCSIAYTEACKYGSGWQLVHGKDGEMFKFKFLPTPAAVCNERVHCANERIALIWSRYIVWQSLSISVLRRIKFRYEEEFHTTQREKWDIQAISTNWTWRKLLQIEFFRTELSRRRRPPTHSQLINSCQSSIE